ncbi:hypothetical protein FOZ63_001522, partial [Perkinsus olseni]
CFIIVFLWCLAIGGDQEACLSCRCAPVSELGATGKIVESFGGFMAAHLECLNVTGTANAMKNGSLEE